MAVSTSGNDSITIVGLFKTEKVMSWDSRGSDDGPQSQSGGLCDMKGRFDIARERPTTLSDGTHTGEHHRIGEPGGTEPSALSPHHRHVISHLAATGGQASLVELARDVAAGYNGREADVDPREIRRLYLTLRRTVLEDLTSQGIVEYCDEEGTVHLLA